MAEIHGSMGNVVFAAGHVVNVKSWTIDVAQDVAPTGDFADTWRGKVAGLRQWSGSYSVEVDDTTGPEIGDLAGNTGAAAFYFSAAHSLSGTILIVGSDTGANVDEGPEEIVFNFVGDGALVVAGPPSCASASDA